MLPAVDGLNRTRTGESPEPTPGGLMTPRVGPLLLALALPSGATRSLLDLGGRAPGMCQA